MRGLTETGSHMILRYTFISGSSVTSSYLNLATRHAGKKVVKLNNKKSQHDIFGQNNQLRHQ